MRSLNSYHIDHQRILTYKQTKLISDEKSTIDVKISANSFFGARHGLSTLQQLIWYDDEDEILKIISTATIEDCPKFG